MILFSLYTTYLSSSQSLIEKGGDWDRRNRLKVYSAVHFLSIRKFQEAANLFLDCLSTFTATELMEYDDFVALTVVATGVGCDRAGIKTKVCRKNLMVLYESLIHVYIRS
jgi:26S proteasome regulatory subunit N7